MKKARRPWGRTRALRGAVRFIGAFRGNASEFSVWSESLRWELGGGTRERAALPLLGDEEEWNAPLAGLGVLYTPEAVKAVYAHDCWSIEVGITLVPTRGRKGLRAYGDAPHPECFLRHGEGVPRAVVVADEVLDSWQARLGATGFDNSVKHLVTMAAEFGAVVTRYSRIPEVLRDIRLGERRNRL